MLQWNLPYPLSGHLHCLIGHVACSLLTIMKFGLDESTRREPKGYCLPVWWLVYPTNNNLTTTWLLGDNGFLQARGMTMNVL